MSALLLAVKHNCASIVDWILETYGTKKINLFARDYDGNTILHHAVLNENLDFVRLIYEIDSSQCMLKNH